MRMRKSLETHGVFHFEDYMLSKVDGLILLDLIINKEENVHEQGSILWRKQKIYLSGHLHNYHLETTSPHLS